MLPLICALLGAVISGWPGAVIGFALGCVAGATLSKGRRRDALATTDPAASADRPKTVPAKVTTSPQSPVERIRAHMKELTAAESVAAERAESIHSAGIGVSLSFGTVAPPSAPVRRAKTKLVWHAPSEPLIHAGLMIDAGMVFVSERALQWPGEPSAIISSISVAEIPAHPSADFGYYPSYDRISAEQRRCYLEWLADGRKDIDPAQRSLGYVFLFFYGVERRVFLDGDRDPRLIEELVRLLEHYGSAHKSRSLRSYFLQLLHFAGWQLGSDAYRALWPRFLEFDSDRPDEDGLRFVLANLYQRGEPLDWTVAYRLALSDVESRRSTVVARAQEKFFALFERRFRERFGDGLNLEAAKQEAMVQYRPASNALVQIRYQQRGQNRLELRIPNVSGLHSQFKPLPAIWNSCVEDLSGYSRALASNKQGQSAVLAKWQALPAELRQAEDHPLKSAFDELVANAPHENDYTFLPTGTLATLAGISERAKLTAAQGYDISELINGLGWNLAPDPRITGLPLSWDQEVALYRVDAHQPAPNEVIGVVRLLYLALTVAAADGVVESQEIESFYRLVASQLPSENHWHPIRATEASLRRDPHVAVRSLPQMSKLIPPENRQFVLRLLSHIAAADSEVSLDELKVLRRIARAFQLEPDSAEKLFREDEAFQAVTIAAGERGRERGEPIPNRPTDDSHKFALDEERIKALTQETHEVISMLSVVMAEPEDEAPCPPADTPAPPSPPSADVPWLSGIGERYRGAVLTLVRHDALTPTDFDCIAAEHRLLPDDLFDSINTWADDTFGDFLLERGENVRIFRSLIPELAALPVAA